MDVLGAKGILNGLEDMKALRLFGGRGRIESLGRFGGHEGLGSHEDLEFFGAHEGIGFFWLISHVSSFFVEADLVFF